MADCLRDEVKLISFEVSLSEAEVIGSLVVALASVTVLALDENSRCVDVSRVDSEDDANPLLREITVIIISNTHQCTQSTGKFVREQKPSRLMAKSKLQCSENQIKRKIQKEVI